MSRRALASELGMSVIPVTEAIQRLEMDGLVESWPRVGTRVKVPTAQDIRDSVYLPARDCRLKLPGFLRCEQLKESVEN